MSQALFAKRGSRKLDAVLVDNTWLSVERLASVVASVCDTTWFFKNAWRPLRRPCVRPRVFCGVAL